MSGIDVGADPDWYAWFLPMAMGIHPKMFQFGSREPAKKNWNCVAGGRVHPTPCCSNANRMATTSFHGRTKAKWESFFANEVQGSCSQSHWCWSNSGSMAEDCCSLQRKNLGKQGLFTLHLFYGCLAVTPTWLFFSAVLNGFEAEESSFHSLTMPTRATLVVNWPRMVIRRSWTSTAYDRIPCLVWTVWSILAVREIFGKVARFEMHTIYHNLSYCII